MKKRLNIKNIKYNTLQTNIFYLFIFQVANYLVPIITIPLIISHISIESYGKIAFVTSLSGYFLLIMDYSFNLTATRKVAINRDNNLAVEKIISNILGYKLVVSLFWAILVAVWMYSSNWQAEDKILVIIIMAGALAQSLFPIWYFQGIEEMKYITILNGITKIVYAALLWMTLEKLPNILVSPIILTAMLWASTMAAYITIKIKSNLKFKSVSWMHLLEELKEGRGVFFSNIVTSFYTNSVPFVLGVISGPSAVGLYSAAEKVIQGVRGIYSPISQAIYPYIANLSKSNKNEGIPLVKKIFWATFIGMGILSILIFYLSDHISRLIASNNSEELSILIEILSPMAVLISISNLIGINFMLNYGMKKEFVQIISSASALGLLAVIVGSYFFAQKGAAMAVLMTELLVTALMIKFTKNTLLVNNINIK